MKEAERPALLRHVGAVEDAYLDAGQAQRAAAAAALVVEEHARRSRRASIGWWALVGSLAGAAAVAAFALVPRLSVPTFAVGEQATRGRIGEPIAAPGAAAVPVGFSEGSHVTVEPGGRFVVTSLEPEVVRLRLDEGRARVRVRPGQGRAWHVDAGPFVVRVVGTMFVVAWSPAARAFELVLEEGVVTVTGPGLREPRRVAAGESFRGTDVEQPPNEPVAAPAVASDEPAQANEPSGAPKRPADSDARRKPPARAMVRPEPAAPDWRTLALARRYDEAFARASEQSLEALCRSSSADDLLLLADTARAAHRRDEGVRVYGCLRERFPRSEPAAHAAYMLGRVAFELDRDDGAAARWFRRYLDERPEGALGQAALGRLIEAERRGGRTDAARAAAREYLRRFPGGPHADLAGELAR